MTVMDIDFSQANLQYLIQARDLARQDPIRAALLLELPEELVNVFNALTPHQLAQVAHFRSPLLVPRREAWWWSRLFAAVRDGRQAEIDAILEHTILLAPPLRGESDCE